MAEHGLSDSGFSRKRLDEILEDLHETLSEGFGINTRENPESLLNVVITNFSDSLAELWEIGEGIWNNTYTDTAEGISLDRAVQFSGVRRMRKAKTIYPLHCECQEGTVIGTTCTVRSQTNPPVDLTAVYETTVLRSEFNRVKVMVVALQHNSAYRVTLDGTAYEVSTGAEDTEEDVIQGLADAISNTDFDVSVGRGEDEEDTGVWLCIDAVNPDSTHSLLLSENLTTKTVTAVVNFATVDYGEIALPDGSITDVLTAPAGFLGCTNIVAYIAGRETETDAELRESYQDKVTSMSSRMLSSIKSAIMDNVQGVESVVCYENEKDEYDEKGLPPHSIRIIVDGGSNNAIAEQILLEKTSGIYPDGNVEVKVLGEDGEIVVVRFSRPENIYVWFKIDVVASDVTELPGNYDVLLKKIVVEHIDDLPIGAQIAPQRWLKDMYDSCAGIDYIDIAMCTSTDNEHRPSEYGERIVTLGTDQKAVTFDSLIAISLNGGA